MIKHRFIQLIVLLGLCFPGITANLIAIHVLDPMGQNRYLIAESNGKFAIVEDDI